MAGKRTSEAPSRQSSLTREKYLAAALRRFETLSKKAETKGAFGPAVQAKKEETRIRAELDQLRETARRTATPSSIANHKAEILSEVRRLRQGATEAGSWVAAASLLKAEAELVAAEELAASTARERELKAASSAELVKTAQRILAELEAKSAPRPN